jgi:hypothetical protein
MPIIEAAVGIAHTILASVLGPDSWVIRNQETGETLVGDFPHESLVRGVSNNIATITSLNRQRPILQFLNGEVQTLGLKARFRQNTAVQPDPSLKMETLIKWAQLDPLVRRLPVCLFAMGNDSQLTREVVIRAVTNIDYSQATRLGVTREISFDLEMWLHTPFSMDEVQETDTRYARVKERQYYELLAQEEYGSPMLGVIIRQRHPRLLVPVPGDIVKLPSIEGVRHETPSPQSTLFKSAFGRRDTPARQLRQEFFDRHSGPYTSFLVNITPRR